MGDFGATLAAASILLGAAPRGDGHSVLVLPGFLAEDSSTAALRTYLRSRRYDVHGWGLGRNLGPTERALGGMASQLSDLYERSGRPVSIVGWSLGGIFARELARQQPDMVRQVITLGSPFQLADPRHSRANPAYERLSNLHVNAASLPRRRDLGRPIPVPATAIYSRFDGIVRWQACLEVPGPRRENVAVFSSHLGLGLNPAALWVVADRLAQAEGEWRPFRAPSIARRLFFPAPAARAA